MIESEDRHLYLVVGGEAWQRPIDAMNKTHGAGSGAMFTLAPSPSEAARQVAEYQVERWLAGGAP